MGRSKIWKKFSHGPIPVNARLNPDRHFGAVSTEIYERIHSFVDKHPEMFMQDTRYTEKNLLPSRNY